VDKRTELAELLTVRISNSKASAGYFSKYMIYPGWTQEAYDLFLSRIDLDKREVALFETTLAGVSKLPAEAVDALLGYYKTPS
jgi:hypothetical protein